MEYILPSQNELLSSIGPNMKMTKGFFRRIYGYSITDPDFEDKALSALQAAGCTNARQYYDSWVMEYEAAYDAGMKSVAEWYSKECEKAWEAKVKEVRGLREKSQRAKQNRQEHWTELSEALSFPSTNGVP